MLQTQTTHQTTKRRGHRVGLALAGGGPLGGIYEIGALLALNEALKGVDSIRHRLGAAVARLDSLSRDIQKNPKRYFHFSIF